MGNANFDNKLISLDKKITQIKHLLVKNELKICKHKIQFILEVRAILKRIVLQIV